MVDFPYSRIDLRIRKSEITIKIMLTISNATSIGVKRGSLSTSINSVIGLIFLVGVNVLTSAIGAMVGAIVLLAETVGRTIKKQLKIKKESNAKKSNFFFWVIKERLLK